MTREEEGADAEPRCRGRHWAWEGRRPGIEVRFVGRGPTVARKEVLWQVEGSSGLQVAWARQVHSARVLPARLGDSGQGDALWTAEADLALSVATADCVPVLLGGGGVAAAIHAGWRGIAAGILGATISALPAAPGELTAWIGPAIGPCCYEVGEDVAERVAGDARSQVVLPGARGRPHLDLARAVSLRLAEHGVGRVIEIPSCTRCDSERLWSFRRDGAASGRNLAFVWLRG